MNFILYAIVVLTTITVDIYAEIYKGIGPLDNLASLKTKFPNASFEDVKPAWAKKDEFLYKITGSGLVGTIIVKFDDGNERAEISHYEMRRYIDSLKTAGDTTYMNFWSGPYEYSEGNISVSWTRWIPDIGIPLARYVAKYGQFTKSGFSDDDLQPYRSWENKGIFAYLSDDQKSVTRVDFNFTNRDYRIAYQEKYGFVPEWLKDPAPKKPQAKKTVSKKPQPKKLPQKQASKK
jgi:hypothetical protein